jgi:hypothetical protein
MSLETHVLPAAGSKAGRFKLRPRARRALLTLHIVAGVGLLGSVAAVLAINITAAGTGDPGLATASYDLLAMFTVLFGIPLSLTALATGILLGLSSAWGVLRYAWVVAKLGCSSACSWSGRSCSAPGPRRCAAARAARRPASSPGPPTTSARC